MRCSGAQRLRNVRETSGKAVLGVPDKNPVRSVTTMGRLSGDKIARSNA